MESVAVKLYRVVKSVPSVLTAETMPRPKLPASLVVPYRVLPDKINPASRLNPTLVVKLCKVVKPVPSVLTANTVPLPKLPPTYVVPYKVSPDKVKPDNGQAPSLFVP